jgi:hypothetical protein
MKMKKVKNFADLKDSEWGASQHLHITGFLMIIGA